MIGFRLCPTVVVILCLVTGGCKRSPQDYVVAGNKFFSSNKFQDAELQYQKAIQLDASYGEAFYRLALLQLEQHKPEEALRNLAMAVKFSPDNQDAKVKFGDMSLLVLSTPSTNRELPLKIATQLRSQVDLMAEQLLAKDPKSFDGWRFRGALAMLDRNPEEAAQAFQKANEAKPGQAGLLVDYGQALIAAGRQKEGEKVIVDAIERNATFTQAYDVLYRQFLLTKRRQEGEVLLKTRVAKNPKDTEGIILLARHYWAEHKPAEVTSTLNRMTGNLRDFPKAYLAAGAFYASLGAWEEAKQQFRLGTEANPSDPSPYQKGMINVLLTQGRPDEALTLVEQILKRHATDPEAQAVRASILTNRGRPDDLANAQADLETLVKQSPANPDLRFSLGSVYLKRGSRDKAREQFLEARKLRRSFLPPRYSLAEIALQQGKPEEAQQYAAEALKISPNDPRARLLSAASLSGQGKFDAARRELGNLLREFPQFRDAELEMGVLAIREKDFKKAEQIFRGLYRPNEADVRPTAGLVEAYLSQQQSDRALQFLRQELAQSPNQPAIRLMLATTAMRSGRLQEAIEQYQFLLSKNPQSVDILLLLADAHYRSSDLGSAIATYDKAITISPKAPHPLMLRSFMLQKIGRQQEATNGYRRVLELDPNNVGVMNNLAFLLAESGGDLNEALRFAKEAARRLPNEPEVADTLGWVYLKQNQLDSALRIFEINSKKQPNNAVFRYHLGSAFLAKGDKESARRELSTALTKSPSKEVESRVQALLSKMKIG